MIEAPYKIHNPLLICWTKYLCNFSKCQFGRYNFWLSPLYSGVCDFRSMLFSHQAKTSTQLLLFRIAWGYDCLRDFKTCFKIPRHVCCIRQVAKLQLPWQFWTTVQNDNISIGLLRVRHVNKVLPSKSAITGPLHWLTTVKNITVVSWTSEFACYWNKQYTQEQFTPVS